MRSIDFNPEGRETCGWCAGHGKRYVDSRERADCPDCGGTGTALRRGETVEDMLVSIARTRARMFAQELKEYFP